MLIRVAQVRCYNCGRTCGEVKGFSIRDLDLKHDYILTPFGGCRPTGGASPRCARCGGGVYLDEPFTARPGELFLTGKVSYPVGLEAT